MDFDCEQDNNVHFFYTLPFSKKNALVETTWLSNLNHRSVHSYETQLKDYLENHLNIKKYKVLFREKGAIPLFHPKNIKKLNQIDIGTAGGMTRLSTGYTFLNIQEHSKFIRKNLDNVHKLKPKIIPDKYQFLDKIFLKVLTNNPKKMPDIFYKMFSSKNSSIINFLSNKSNILEDFQIVSKMPKWTFFKELFKIY
jgi:lycopene beta-cyclase